MPIPLLGAVQAGAGALQTIFGGIGQIGAQHRFEKLLNQSPKYTRNASIIDYYNKALQRYNVNPYQSDLYRMQEQQANRGLATGLSALNDRRSALAGISGLVQGRNDSLLGAAATARQQQGQDLSQLGSAANAKANEEGKEFEINKLMPYQARLNQLASKASGNANVVNAGLSNIFGGLQSGVDADMIKQIYGNNSSSSGGYTGNQSGITLADIMGRRKH